MILLPFDVARSQEQAPPNLTADDIKDMKTIVTEYIAAFNDHQSERMYQTYTKYSNHDSFITSQDDEFKSTKIERYSDVVLSEPQFNSITGSYEIEVTATFTQQLGDGPPKTMQYDTYFGLASEEGHWKIRGTVYGYSRTAYDIRAQFRKEDRLNYYRAHRQHLDRDVVQALVNLVDSPGQEDPHRFLDLGYEVAHEAGDPASLAVAEMADGNYRALHHDPGGAIDAYEDALSNWKKTGDRAGQAWASSAAGDQFAAAGKWPEAEAQHRAALLVFQQDGDSSAVLVERVSIANAEAAQGKNLEAEKDLSAVLREVTQDPQKFEYAESRALEARRRFYLNAGRYSEALADAKQYLEISKKSPYALSKSMAYADYVTTLIEAGRYEDAIRIADEGLQFAKQQNDNSSTAILLRSKGAALDDLGQNELAIDTLSEALAANQQTLNPSAVMETQIHGEIVDILARNFLANNTEIARELSYADQAATRSNDVFAQTDIDIRQGEYVTRTINIFEPILPALEKDPLWGTQLVRDEITKYRQNRPTFVRYGEDRLSRAVATSTGTKNLRLQARAHAARAELFAAVQPDDPRAMQEIHDAMDAASASGDSPTRLLVTESEARVLLAQHRWDDAINILNDAIARIEQSRAGVRDANQRTSYFAVNTWPYRALARTYIMVSHQPDIPADHANRALADALTSSERVRARALEDALTSAPLPVTQKMTDDERKQDQLLSAQVAAAQAELDALLGSFGNNDTLRHDAEDHLSEARAKQNQFHADLLTAHGSAGFAVRNNGTVEYQDIHSAMKLIDSHTAVLEYLVDDTSTFLFVISPAERPGSTDIHVLELDVPRFEILSLRAKAEDAFQNPDARYESVAASLYKTLLQPAEKALQGKDHLIIVPDSDLAGLPFQAFLKDKSFLVESVAVSYAPSLAALGRMTELARQRQENWSTQPLQKRNVMLAMGAPIYPPGFAPLKGAEQELQQVANLFHTRPYTGADATRANALKLLPDARYVHFATHSRLDSLSSLRSAIVLTRTESDYGFLEAQDLLNQNLKAEMVVLSACNTGSGESVNGEGIQGLAWALFIAGSPTNVVTQWEVSDRSTEEIMSEFYQRLLGPTPNGGPSSKAQALRAAQLRVLHTEKNFTHPYYWAPFIITGAAQ